MIKEILPHEAMAILEQDPNAILLDVRTTMEYEYVGHPVGALHIPWMEFPEWRVDPNFVEKVRKALTARGKDPVESTPILALCRSGKRSEAAAFALAAAGFTHAYNIAEGFEGDRDAQRHRSTVNGWRFRGLPWEQG